MAVPCSNENLMIVAQINNSLMYYYLCFALIVEFCVSNDLLTRHITFINYDVETRTPMKCEQHCLLMVLLNNLVI